MNPYDSCVANKVVDGKQMTVVWHVDYLKASHKTLCVLKVFGRQLNDEFGGKETPITESYGKQHDYLGMTFDYSIKGEVNISMADYVKLILHDVPEDMAGMSATPAGNHLFKANEKNPEPLSPEKKDAFVHIVMQMLYLSQRGQPDIRMAVSFL